MKSIDRKIIEVVRELHAISSAGILYTKEPFDKERYIRLREIAAELLSEISEDSYTKIIQVFEANSGYQTPKLSTRSVVFNQSDEILLVKDYDGKWVIPGGWCDYNKTIIENTKKEAFEEAGLIVEPYRLVGLFDHYKRNNSNSFFFGMHVFMLCRVVGGEFHQNIETTQSGYFSLDGLPVLNEHKTSKEQIDICYQSFKADHWIPVVD